MFDKTECSTYTKSLNLNVVQSLMKFIQRYFYEILNFKGLTQLTFHDLFFRSLTIKIFIMKINMCGVCKLAMLNVNMGFYFALAHKIEFYEKST